MNPAAVISLCKLVAEEIKFLGSVGNKVKEIEKEFNTISSFLTDADARAAAEEGQSSNRVVTTWVQQVREEAYRIEDVLSKYSYRAAKLPDRGGCIAAVFWKLWRFVEEAILSHAIVSEIDAIQSSLAKIQNDGKSFNFQCIEPGSSGGSRSVAPHDSRIGSFFIDDAEFVDDGSTRTELINLLVNGTAKRSVIVLAGEGGLGKTVLAGKIYHNEAVGKHFNRQILVTVGKEYNKKNLLRLIKQEFDKLKGIMPTKKETMEEEIDMIKYLRESLNDERYLIFFDDVWKVEFWEDVKPVLPENDKGSRILITTRNKGVADYAKSSSICHFHMLQPLPTYTAMQLFCKKAFGSEKNCPQALWGLSYEIVLKCGCVPLAIVAVGGILSNKNHLPHEWKKLLDGMGSRLESDPHLRLCSRVLCESYYDLPLHLKSCFLYFGLFPENSIIPTEDLFDLWIAEGLVPCNNDSPPEQVAEDYLHQLIDRSLVQVTCRNVAGLVESCRVQEFMREIIVKKSRELNFCQALDGKDLSHCNGSRRISICGSGENILKIIKDSEQVRSLKLFNIDSLPESFMAAIVPNFKLIKVLGFHNVALDRLPNDLGKLFYLRYLSLACTNVKELPKSIGMLINLDTLDLRWSKVRDLPVEIKNLKKLRCLYADKDGVKIHKGLGALKGLQKLLYLISDSRVINNKLKKLMQLRKLGVNLPNGDVKDLFDKVSNLEHLTHLMVRTESNEIIDTQQLARPSLLLQRFKLKANITKLPGWIFELQNLISVGLSSTDSSFNISMAEIQALPHLLRLNLHWKHCEELNFEQGWFPKLQRLHLEDFEQLKLVTVEKGAMINLRELEMGPCPLLKEIPGIEHLTNLKTLTFVKMLKEAYCMITSGKWEQVAKHIPEIYVTDHYNYFYTDKFLKFQTPETVDQFIQTYNVR